MKALFVSARQCQVLLKEVMQHRGKHVLVPTFVKCVTGVKFKMNKFILKKTVSAFDVLSLYYFQLNMGFKRISK